MKSWPNITVCGCLALALGCGSSRDLPDKAGDVSTEAAQPSALSDVAADVEDRAKDATPTAPSAEAGDAPATETAGAAAEADPEKPSPPPQRFVIFAPAGPLVCALSVTVGGHRPEEALDQLVDEALAAITPSDDGSPTWSALVESRAFRSGQFGSAPIKSAEERKQTISRYDWNRNGRVEADEMRRLLTRNQGLSESLSVRSYDAAGGQNAAAAPVWQLLDADEDQILSADELAGAADRLHRRDARGDEILVLSELVADPMPSKADKQSSYESLAPLAHLIVPRTDWQSLWSMIREVYPRSRGESVAAWLTSIRLLGALDRDGSGSLSREELSSLVNCPPHLAIAAHFGADRTTGAAPPLTIHLEINADMWTAGPIEIEGNALRLAMPLLTLEWSLIDAGGGGDEKMADSQFSRYDTDNNGYLDQDEVRPAEQQLAPFEALDANDDDKVFPDEVAVFVERRRVASASLVQVNVQRGADPVFATLDADHDGRLGAREIAAAGKRLAALDANNDGRLTPDEIPNLITVQIARGSRGNDAGTKAMSAPTPAQARRSGLPWFQRMDANADGDVSPREFLGTRERFDATDSNHDGFIDPQEAEQAAAAPPAGG